MKSNWQHQIVHRNTNIGRLLPLFILILLIAIPAGGVIAAPDAAPGAFGKTSPTNGTPGRSSSLTLYWSSSSGATSYQYCYDTTPNGTCDGSWVNVGTNTSWGISGLSVGTIYYWQVQAVNVDGTTPADGGNWWNFSTSPGNFNKTSPAHLATGQVTDDLQLEWTTSTGAETYEYCISTSPSCTVWTEVGNTLTTTVDGLTPGTTYFWQVRADLGGGTTEANSGSWFQFYTLPDPFGKSSPTDGATGQSSITLSWSASTGAAGYYYCFDTIDNDACNTSWTGISATSAAITTNPGTTYYWHVRSVYQGGYTESDDNAWWSFSTAPAGFTKTSPSNGATGVSINPNLSWNTATGAATYEYCYDTSGDSTCNSGSWVSTGSLNNVALSGLTAGQTYYWQVRAVFNGGYTYANNGSWYSFTTLPLPATFNKINPPDTSVERPLSFTLSWGSATYASSYQYCYDTVDDDICAVSWTPTGSTSATIGGLVYGETYYWQVQAVNASGTTDANGGTWWSFSTAPGAFGKSTPTNNTTGLSTSFNLTWAGSTGAASYEYCYDPINNSTCDSPSTWTSAGSTSVTISGLDTGETYYWQVRAVYNGGYTYANSGTWWTFHTAPDAFGKTSPTNLAVGQALSGLQLQWETSSGAVSYEYCYSTISPVCPGSWTSVGGNQSSTLGSLNPSAIYYWQVRAVYNGGYTYANGGTWWSFYTRPPDFNKTAPTHLSSGQPTSITLSWQASAGATSYVFCYDTVNNSSCDAPSTWTSTGSTSAGISGLTPGTAYYWQVRSVYQGGYTDANSGTWWTFYTAPGVFNKVSPSNQSNAQATSLTLSWGASQNATAYEYCLDTSDDDACSGWTSVGTNTSAVIGGLSPAASYYWQVRAVYNGGHTYADGSSTAFWGFHTAPGSFTKADPGDGSSGLSTSLNLSWEPSDGAQSYQYCYDSIDDDTCTNWTSTGSSTSAAIGGLVPGLTYYWQVQAFYQGGETFANGSATAYWSFSTAPGAFNKTLPLNGSAGLSIPVTLQWGASQNASSYEFCVSLTSSCTGPWSTDTGNDRTESISSLTPGMTYYWQVRAVFNGGYTYANSNSWWVFHTAPGEFGRLSPSSEAAGVSTNPTLTWSASQNASSYEYCYDTSHDIYCDSAWIPTGNTSVSLGGLSAGTGYSWHVRAIYAGGYAYADGVDTTFWRFFTAPGPFAKTGPADGVDSQPTNLTLSWGVSSGAGNYQFCYDTSDDEDCDGSWSMTTNTSAAIGGLTPGATYFWQVKAVLMGGTTDADGGSWFSFSIGPGAFNKIDPADIATERDTTLTLTWGNSQNATLYEYCLDDTTDSTCNGSWTPVGTSLSVEVSGLSDATTYEWQVRSSNTGGTTEANSGTWWTFSTLGTPATFSKLSPTPDQTNVSILATLTWEDPGNATSFEYCIDMSDDDICDGDNWVSVGSDTTVTLPVLDFGMTYYWHVRAVNEHGTTYANEDTWWGFTTLEALGIYIPMVLK